MYGVLMVVVATSVSKVPAGNCQNCLCHEVYVFEGLGMYVIRSIRIYMHVLRLYS